MSTSLEELDSFTQFAQRKLVNGEDSLTLEDCFRLWRQQCEQQATLDDIRQGMIDLDNGLGKPLDQAFDDVRRKLGLS